jgi:hypothetical protein
MHKYLFRTATRRKSGWYAVSLYHLVAEDGQTSVCGAATTGEFGFVIVEKEKPMLRSRTCSNCQMGRRAAA